MFRINVKRVDCVRLFKYAFLYKHTHTLCYREIGNIIECDLIRSILNLFFYDCDTHNIAAGLYEYQIDDIGGGQIKKFKRESQTSTKSIRIRRVSIRLIFPVKWTIFWAGYNFHGDICRSAFIGRNRQTFYDPNSEHQKQKFNFHLAKWHILGISREIPSLLRSQHRLVFAHILSCLAVGHVIIQLKYRILRSWRLST